MVSVVVSVVVSFVVSVLVSVVVVSSLLAFWVVSVPLVEVSGMAIRTR